MTFKNCPRMPLTVDLAKDEGRVGEFILQGDRLFQSGLDPKFEIKFAIDGTVLNGVRASRAG